MPRKRDEETPGARRERERLERQVEDAKERRRVRDADRYQQQKAERARQRAVRDQQPQQLGRNEAAVVEYLKRHPDATTKDVAFHAIYGGGTVAWEGLHRKTRSNAEAEASRVINRLKNRGAVTQSGWTGGGRPRWGVTRAAAESEPGWLQRWVEGKPDPGEDQPTPRRRRSWGIGSAADSGEPDPPKRGGGRSKSGASELLGLPSSDDDDGGDDDDDGGIPGLTKPSW